MNDTREEFTQRIQKRQSALKATCKELFTNSKQTLMLEIGSGHGHFLVAYAREHPDTLCVGIDIQGKRVEKGVKKQEKESLSNLHFIKAEALEFLDALPAGILFNEVYILFPDPWPKKRHHKNRLIQPEFLSLIANKTKNQGMLYFRTDHEDYFKWASKVFNSHVAWNITGQSQLTVEEETVFQKRMGQYQTLIAQKVQ